MQPLADKLRAKTVEELVGQEHLFTENSTLNRALSSDFLMSMIFWGPAGTGKTTIAKLLIKKENYFSEIISATNIGVAELKKIFELAQNRLKDFGKSTIVFIDEIHCFKKNQQDVLLPYVENGTIILIGATTENPSFELNNALLSRCKVIVFKALSEEALLKLIDRAERDLNKKLPINKEQKEILVSLCNGDGRFLLNMCEELFEVNSEKELTSEEVMNIIQKKGASYDKKNDGHYNLISALHKSVRGSDVQASLYWFSRMLEAGENPHFILRRIIRIAVEDIGMADPQALVQCISAKEAYDFLGSPEGELAIVQALIYCATAPKSNAQYNAFNEVFNDAKINNYQDPPKHILNAPTKLMKDLGYNEGYIYDHDTENCFSGQNYFPEKMKRREYYKPNERGFEREIKKRLEYWKNLREKINKLS